MMIDFFNFFTVVVRCMTGVILQLIVLCFLNILFHMFGRVIEEDHYAVSKIILITVNYLYFFLSLINCLA